MAEPSAATRRVPVAGDDQVADAVGEALRARGEVVLDSVSALDLVEAMAREYGGGRPRAVRLPGGPVCYVRVVPGTSATELAGLEDPVITPPEEKIAGYCALYLCTREGKHLGLPRERIAGWPATWLAHVIGAGHELNGLRDPNQGE